MRVKEAGPISFGMPTLLETESLADALGLCARLGLDFVEINMNTPQYQIELLESMPLARMAEDAGVGLTLHLEEGLNVADFNPLVAAAYRETVRRALAVAAGCGMPVVNMHLAQGILVTLPERRVYLFWQHSDLYLAALRAFRDACDSALCGGGLLLCVENTNGFAQHERQAVDLLLQSPHFALTLDVGHNHAAKLADEDFYAVRQSRLRHMHLHDAKGTANHLALGDGEEDLDARLATAQKCGCRVVLETKTVAALEQSVRWLKGHGWM